VTIIVTTLSIYAIVSELAQGLMGRYADVGDVIANLAGAIVGAAAVWIAQAKLRDHRRKIAPRATPQPDRA
jgi:VanZ family protein